MKTTRREFLKRSAAAGALASVPYIWTSRYARAADVNSQPTIAAIGVGGSRGRYSQGGHDAQALSEFGQMIAVCDVDELHCDEFNRRYGGELGMYTDYRELFEKESPDVVVIGTPDHWHIPISLAAMKAGCDVYCEKPLTLTLEEGPIIQKAVKDTGRVFQVGTQQRSQDEYRFLKAIAMVKSGRLGKNVKAYVAVGEGRTSSEVVPPTDPPADLKWDIWLGPAQQAGYSTARRLYFRWWFDYSGGIVTDWGAHHMDIARWALGLEEPEPFKVSGTCAFPPNVIPDNFDWNAYFRSEAKLPELYNTVNTFAMDLKFTSGPQIHFTNYYRRESDNTSFGNGILFEGEEGRIFVNRESLNGAPLENLSEEDKDELNAMVIEIYKGKRPGNHARNFMECVQDRSEPISDVNTHIRCMEACHATNIAMMLGRELEFDPEKAEFVGDEEATALMIRPRRAPYDKLDT